MGAIVRPTCCILEQVGRTPLQNIHGGGHASAAVRGTTVAEKLKMSVRVPGNPLTERLVQKPRRRQGEYPARPHTA